MNLNELAAEIHQDNVDRGFWEDERPLGVSLMLITTELAEALEEERAGRPGYWVDAMTGKPEGIDTEIVDALIRILDLLGQRGADVEAILDEKLRFNRGRGYRHGKEF